MTNVLRKDARCGGEQEPVQAPELRAAGLATEDLHLVAKDEDLDLAVALIAGGNEAEDDAQHNMKEGEAHPRIVGSCWSEDESMYWYPSGSDSTRPSAANLDIATIDREWEAIRRVVGAEGGGVFKRSHTEERRDVRRRPGALAIVSHVPPTAEADERRLVGLADRSADPGIVADHREARDLAPGCERDPVFDVTVVEPTVGAPVAQPGGESELLEHERI